MGRKVLALRLIILSVFIIGLCWMFWAMSSNAEAVEVNLVLQEQEKVYLFSLLGTNHVKQYVARQNTPEVMPFVQIFQDGGMLYLQPKDLKEIVNILCGNYRIHEYPEKSFEGYITTTQMKCMNHYVRNENTSQIGEQIKINELSLSSPVSDSTFTIQWSTNYISEQVEVLQNCIKKPFKVIEKAQQGQNISSTKEFVVVKLEDVASFYGRDIMFRLDAKNQLLYVSRGMIN